MTIGVSLTTAARSWKATVKTRWPPPMPMEPKSRWRSLRTMQYTYFPPSTPDGGVISGVSAILDLFRSFPEASTSV